MADTARYIENWIGVLVEEAEANGLAEVARLLKLASEEAREVADLMELVSRETNNSLHFH